MTSVDAATEKPPKKGGILPVLIGLFLAVAGAGGGFYLVHAGLIFGQEPQPNDLPIEVSPMENNEFVALDPLVISLGSGSPNKHLRFTAHLEVDGKYVADVEKLRPRIMDVLNSYLRAVEAKLFEETASLTRLRAQMLRRLQIVAGEGRIKDILIIEFVLN